MRYPTRALVSRRQVGDSKIGCLFWLILMGAFALFAWQAVPAKLKATELESFIERQAETAGLSRSMTSKKITKLIVERAEEIGVPVTEEDIEVQKNAARVRISCSYAVPIDMLVYSFDWQFNIAVDRQVMNI